MTTRSKNRILRSAIVGLCAGATLALAGCSKADAGSHADGAKKEANGCSGHNGCKAEEAKKDANGCAGKNGCKGQEAKKDANTCSGHNGCDATGKKKGS